MKPSTPPSPHGVGTAHRPNTAPGAEGATVRTGGGADEVVVAQTLLAGRPWVAIEHNGQHYRLQTTRAGKLILTK